ncbi:hypothetical protein D6C84_10092 [Aureobasidium pullulans]|uniref:Uncharacterized protein n=1 Tax=Aureobasidium pullulans TaxID=5580 RepID=A0A4S9X0C4_AURPU|nr:hypothetical protein D6C84_10092 [Aureobasidium pullulans]
MISARGEDGGNPGCLSLTEKTRKERPTNPGETETKARFYRKHTKHPSNSPRPVFVFSPSQKLLNDVRSTTQKATQQFIMSDQQNNQDLTMSKNKAGKQPLQDAAQPDNRPLSLGYSIEGLAKPGDFEHTDMFPGINLNHNIEKGYKQNFDDMIDMFGKGKALQTENVAHMLLTRGDLPVLYRTHAHVILSYGPVDRLYHARKAVQAAEQGITMSGDDEGVGTELLAVANHALADARTKAADTRNDTDAEKEDGEKKKPKQKEEKDTAGQ